MSDEERRRKERDAAALGEAGGEIEAEAEAARCRVGLHRQPLAFRPTAYYGSTTTLQVDISEQDEKMCWPLVCEACGAEVGKVRARPAFIYQPRAHHVTHSAMVSFTPAPPGFFGFGGAGHYQPHVGFPVVALPTPSAQFQAQLDADRRQMQAQMEAELAAEQRMMQLEQARLEQEQRRFEHQAALDSQRAAMEAHRESRCRNEWCGRTRRLDSDYCDSCVVLIAPG